MMWHCHLPASQCQTIVMVTREVEQGNLKCHRYWPDPTSNPPRRQGLYSLIEVKHLSTTPQGFYTLRKFEITSGSETRQLSHFAYESWPDHGVPLTAKEFLSFRQAVHAAHDKGPLLVHCSAGVGRTGTFITIDM